MRYPFFGVCLLGLWVFGSSMAAASSWSVSPTRVELTAPSSASALTLRNNGKNPVNVQIRVFRWSQVNGVERLTPTSDVVASPPATRLKPFNDYLVRVVRTSKSPVAGEESYRLLIDELPDAGRARNGVINFTVRFSVPVYFKTPDASLPSVLWNVERTKQGLVLSATNSGNTKLRFSDLELKQGEKIVGRLKDATTVLGGATMVFTFESAKDVLPGLVRLKALSDMGVIEADVSVGN
jgi:fimbrial chaperone protein